MSKRETSTLGALHRKQVSGGDQLPKRTSLNFAKEGLFRNSRQKIVNLIYTRSILSLFGFSTLRLQQIKRASLLSSVFTEEAEPAIFQQLHISAQCAAFRKTTVPLYDRFSN